MKGENNVPSRRREAFLISRVLHGEPERFWDLLRPHLPILLRFVRSIIGDDPELEDLVQQATLKAFTRLHQFQFRSRFRTWLFRIALNEALSWRRSSSRVELTDVSELFVEDPRSSPFRDYERAETVKLVRTELAKLPEKYRLVLRLRDLENFSFRQTAKVLGLSVPGTRTRHFRALRQIRGSLAKSAGIS